MAVDYDDVVERTLRLQVSVDHLDAVSSYCTNVGDLVKDIRRIVTDADRTAREGGCGGQSALGGAGLGSSVTDLGTRMKGARDHVDTALRDLTTSLDRTAGAVRWIAAEYATADRRNEVSAWSVLDFVTGRRTGT
ncbi:hypothetical protein GCM10009557_49810 [Virgisporangium ochraceum]|uniref:Uncharacterized protein n=1 Tax=Virgisporangium ochraceum TaxID=65505 RepID=A0A8J4EAE1_9ACTN|nr:hypothetical protein [Virgisporangium ochraceum]GIJ68185.1 hypothetical protein Voc01_031020 [Virgisporangium ochraceum]